ncbi:MAG TPA: cupredoxin domain-containing protein [Candidatus Limnocylindrales bacterium]|nr:cupredoxin domain-containing protein [Candidatus Limnocylindrales bacterium]
MDTSRSPSPRAVVGTLLITLLVVAGCGSGTGSPAPASASEASASPASGSPASAGPDLTPPPGGSTEVVVRALDLAFEPVEPAAPAGQAISLVLDNKDEGIPHDIALTVGGQALKTEIVTGPARASVSIGPLDPGRYPFVCEVHPNMTGTLVVGG